jgi:hypothetical protein
MSAPQCGESEGRTSRKSGIGYANLFLGGRLSKVLAMPLHEADHYADGIISQDVLRSYSYCRYKAFLKLSGRVGSQCAYETALAELRAEARERAIGKLKQEAAGSSIPTSIEISLPTLCLGHRAIIDGELSFDGINVRVDGLRKAAGRSQLGDFHYEPLLFLRGQKRASRN